MENVSKLGVPIPDRLHAEPEDRNIPDEPVDEYECETGSMRSLRIEI